MREGSGGGEVTGIKWVTPRWTVTHREASRRSSSGDCNGEAHARARAGGRRRLKAKEAHPSARHAKAVRAGALSGLDPTPSARAAHASQD